MRRLSILLLGAALAAPGAITQSEAKEERVSEEQERDGRAALAAPGAKAQSEEREEQVSGEAEQEQDGGTQAASLRAIESQPKAIRFEMRSHPTLRIGRWFRSDFRLKFQHDFRTFDPEVSTDEGELANLRKFRVGISGYVTRDFEYEVEREIRNEIGDLFNLRTRQTHGLWRDVYGNFRYFRRAQVRVGQFKIPFGLDQLHYATHGEFVFRSMIGNYLAPGRDLGVMLHGRLLESRVAYQAGIFLHDGWKAHTKDHERSGERTFAARVVLPPFTFFEGPRFLKPFQDLQLGAAITESPVTEGLRSLRGRTWVITHNWFDRINVRGQRLRLGTELNWEPGPFTVKGEVIRVSDQRLGQGIRGEDLPDLIARGWYFTTAWVVTGEKSAGGVVPKRNFVFGKGIGAIQIGARYEQMRFGSAEHPGFASRSSRAANLYSESERIATFGVNWYLNRFMRIQFNGIRELIEDKQKTPIAGQDTYWSRYLRIQFVL